MFGLTKNEKLLKAAKTGDLMGVKHWVESELTDVNAEFYGNKTPLYLALLHGHTDVADYLLERSDTAWPALVTAIEHNKLSVAKYLIENEKIAADYQNGGDGPTPLHIAVEFNRVEIADYLLTKGARLDVPYYIERNGIVLDFTPVQYAEEVGNDKMNALLTRWLHDPNRHLRRPIVTEKETKENSKPVQKDVNKNNLLQMTAEELGDTLQMNRDLLQKLVITGVMAELINFFPYDESLSLYEKVRPQIDNKGRKAMETIIRDKRVKEIDK